MRERQYLELSEGSEVGSVEGDDLVVVGVGDGVGGGDTPTPKHCPGPEHSQLREEDTVLTIE